MSVNQQFPIKKFLDALSSTNQLEKKLKFFINEYKNHNMHWIYQSISAFQRIFSSNKQLPIVKFNALLAIKYCFDTCQYALITLIQVFLLNKITQIALFRSKIKDDSLMATYFSTEGYKEAEHNDLKKISFNFVMLAIQFIFVSSQVKKFRCVENIEIKQASKYVMSAQYLTDKGIKRPQKFSFFLVDYVKDSNKRYQNKLKQFGDDICQLYSEYFLGVIIAQIQTGKKGLLEIRQLLTFGDAYLTSAMINLCEEELSSIQDGFQHKKKYLNLFNEFVRWGDIQAILMINNSDFITQISVNICTVRGDVNINQGQNIYPEIQGKKNEKKEFYVDFLRCIETWAECIPLNEQGLESNVRRIFIFLKQQKKFKFPQNIVLKRYKKQLEQNMRKNQERNDKLLQIINNIDDQEEENQNEEENVVNNSIKMTKKIQQVKKEEKINFEFLQNKITNVENALQEIISTKVNDKQATKKLLLSRFDILKEFNEHWTEWLQQIDLQTEQIQQQDEQRLQEIIINGDQTVEAIEIIQPLIQMFKKNKITLQDFLNRVKQNLQIHQDLTISRSKHLQMTKSITKSTKKDLTNTIHKSILKKSHKNIMSSSKTDLSNYHASKHLVASIYKSKALFNQNANLQKSNNMINSLYKSRQISGLSSIRQSKIHSKLQKIKKNSSHIGQLIESRNQVIQSAEEYFQQNKSIGLINEKKLVNRKDDLSSISSSIKSIDNQRNSKNLQNRKSLQSSKEQKLSELIQSPGSSKNFKSQKNITIVSKNFSEKHQKLEKESKKVVQDMDISDEAEKIVVEYSDIDENQIEKKANEREKQEILKSQQKKSKTKNPDEAFLKVKIQEQKNQKNYKPQSQKILKSPDNQNKKSQRNESSNNPSKNIQYQSSYNKITSFEQKSPKIQSPIQKKVPYGNIISNKFIPFDQDYGGKSTKSNKYDEAETPKRFDKLEKTKKSQSKISITSDDKNSSIRSSKSIRQKIKQRISLKNSQISQRKSLLKDPTQRSLESQLRAMKIEQGSNQSRSLSRKKQGIKVTQASQKQRIKLNPNQEYNYLPKKVLEDEEDQQELSKTKKISESKIELNQKDSQIRLNRHYKQQVNINRNLQNVSSSSLGSRSYRHGISLSLGKRGSILGNQSSLIKRGSILKRKEDFLMKQTEEHKDSNELRPEYFNQNMKKSKHSNRSQIKRRFQENQSQSQNDSSCGDIIRSPNHRPMMQSHYSNKDLKNKFDHKLGFKNYIENGFKEELISNKNQEVQTLMKGGPKREQFQNIIHNNPNSRKAKSQQKIVYGSLLRDKSTQKQVSYLQSRIKALEQESKNMKTKLAVKDQEVKYFRNASDKISFSIPSESNYFSSSSAFRTSRESEKGNFSPMTHQFHNSGFQDNELMKHAKSSQYNQYFEKVKGNTFKKTLLKSKCLIEKQDEIEIGCMNVRKQDFSLEVTVFITPLRFDLTDINYAVLHDQNLALQCHPKKIINIELKKQQKISIKMILKRVPFSIPQIQLTYKSKSEYSTNYFRLPIPILFNKFCQLQSISAGSLESQSVDPDRTIITSQFKLNTKVIKFEKIKEILPNFSYSKNKDFHLLTSSGVYKDVSFWLIMKVNDQNRAIIEGVMNQGQNLKVLQFLMVTLKRIFESQK